MTQAGKQHAGGPFTEDSLLRLLSNELSSKNSRPGPIAAATPKRVLTGDETLDDIRLYRLPRTTASSARLYCYQVARVSMG